MSNPKRKGSRNEHRSMAVLERAGYQCIRSAASLGPFDVIGIGAADIALVQVKSNRWPDGAEAIPLSTELPKAHSPLARPCPAPGCARSLKGIDL